MNNKKITKKQQKTNTISKKIFLKSFSCFMSITLLFSNLLSFLPFSYNVFGDSKTLDSIGSVNEIDDGINVGVDSSQSQKTTYSSEVFEDGSEVTDVYASQASSFAVIIPKVIILDGKKNDNNINTGKYAILVNGDIAGEESINVVPDSEFAMYQTGKDPIKATVVQDKLNWTYKEFETKGNGVVSTTEMSAGSWNGSFNFNIAIDGESTQNGISFNLNNNSLYLAENGQKQVNALLFNEEITSNMTWTSDNENIVVDENGLVKAKEGAKVGDMATITLKVDNPNNDDNQSAKNIFFNFFTKEVFANDILQAKFNVYIIDIDFLINGKTIEKLELRPNETAILEANIIAKENLNLSFTQKMKWSSNDELNIINDNMSAAVTITKNATPGEVVQVEAKYGECEKSYEITVLPLHEECNFVEVARSNESCGESGTIYYQCDICGKTKKEVTEPKEHAFMDFFTIDIEPTCIEDGKKSIHCLHCDFVKDETIIPSNGHRKSTYYTILKEATCTEKGEQYTYCLDCGVTLETEEYGPLGHSYGYGSCIRCEKAIAGLYNENGDLQASWDRLKLDGVVKVDANGVLTTNYYHNTSNNARGNSSSAKLAGKLIIDEEVKTIGNNGFRLCTQLTEVVMPESITTLLAETFYECSGLREVKLSNNITSIGNNAFGYTSSLTKINIPTSLTTLPYRMFFRASSLETIYIPSNVTTIANDVFYEANNLTYISIPSSVTTMGNNVFYNCPNLERVILNEGLTNIGTYSFFSCENLNEIIIPNSVSNIGINCFQDCIGMTNVVLPKDIVSLGDYVFGNCNSVKTLTMPISMTYNGTTFSNITNLETINILKGNGTGRDYTVASYTQAPWYISRNSNPTLNIEEGIASIGNYTFYNNNVRTSITLPTTITKLGTNVFDANKMLENVYNTSNIEIIGNYAFQNCTNLKTFDFYNTQTIGDYAFNNCALLDNFEFSNKLTTISTNAFYGCLIPITLTIPESVTTIGTAAFHSCKGLQEIYIKTSCNLVGNVFNSCTSLNKLEIPISTSMTNSTFSGVTQLKHLIFTKGTGTSYNYTDTNYGITPWFLSRNVFEEVTFSEDVKTIGNYTFYDNTNLNSLIGEENIENIGVCTFYNCKSIVDFDFLNTKTISDTAFRNCILLEDFDFSNNLTTIGPNAFRACAVPTNLVIPESVTSVGASAFFDCTGLTNVIIKGIFTISGSTFKNCKNISNLEMPISSGIGGNGFEGVTNIVNVTLTEGSGTPFNYDANSYVNTPWYLSRNTIEEIVIKAKSIGNFTFYNMKTFNNFKETSNIENIGNSAFELCSILENFDFSNTKTIGVGAFRSCTLLNNFEFTDNLTTIGNNAFQACVTPTNLVIPKTVETIGKGAFYGCSGLANITIDTTCDLLATIFYNNTNLNTLEMPISTKIASDTFAGVSKLKHLTLTEGTGVPVEYDGTTYKYTPWYISRTVFEDATIYSKRIGNFTFAYNNNLQNVYNEENVKYIGISAFDNCINLQDFDFSNTIEIGNQAFRNCKLLNDFDFTENLTTIGTYAFEKCATPTSLIISDKIVKVDTGAFYDCIGLLNVTINSNCTIPTKTFYNNSNIETLKIPISTKIVNDTFTGVTKLKHLTLTEGTGIPIEYDGTTYKYTPWYLSRAVFEDATIYSERIGNFTFAYNNNLQNVYNEENVKYIGISAFDNCINLQDFDFSNTIEIGNQAFRNCKLLNDFDFTENLTTIGTYAFEKCATPSELTIPSSVTKIDTGTFYDCIGLTYLEINANINLPNNAFYNCNGLTRIKMPISSTMQSETFYNVNKLSILTLTKGIGIPVEYNSTTYKYTPWYKSKNVMFLANIESTRIGNYTFCGNTNLRTINYPYDYSNTLIEIGDNAFQDCTNLCEFITNIPCKKIENGITEYYSIKTNNVVLFKKVGANAFSNCTSLRKLNVGTRNLLTIEGEISPSTINIEEIGINAFYNCSNLSLFISGYFYPLNTGKNAFYNVPVVSIKSPITVTGSQSDLQNYPFGALNIYGVTIIYK